MVWQLMGRGKVFWSQSDGRQGSMIFKPFTEEEIAGVQEVADHQLPVKPGYEIGEIPPEEVLLKIPSAPFVESRPPTLFEVRRSRWQVGPGSDPYEM